MEIISSNLGDNRNFKKKLKWIQNIKGEYNLVKDSSIPENNKIRKTSMQIVNQTNEVQKIIDNSEKFKQDMVVMTEWGLGKISKISEGIALVKIEGTEIEFPLFNLNTMITTYICILNIDGTSWAEIKLPFNYQVMDLKSKIARFSKCHRSQVVLVHNGIKIEKNLNIFDLGVYEKDTFLAIIKDTQEFQVLRCKNYKASNKQNAYNAIRIKVNHDIILTGIGFMKNNCSDVNYQLMIFEEEANQNLKLLYSEKQITIKCINSKDENPIYKHKIAGFEIKKNSFYQIHQYLNRTDNNQNIGVKSVEDVEEKNTGIVFSFSNCQILGRENNTNVEEGMIPSIYYFVTSEN